MLVPGYAEDARNRQDLSVWFFFPVKQLQLVWASPSERELAYTFVLALEGEGMAPMVARRVAGS